VSGQGKGQVRLDGTMRQECVGIKEEVAGVQRVELVCVV
jgi:hypothetical protein